jgi:hypothetical protein
MRHLLLAMVGVGLLTSGVMAQAGRPSTPTTSAQDLPRVIEEAKRQYVPPHPERFNSARSRLQQAIARLNQFLARGGRDRLAGWKEYLELDTLQEELKKADAPDVRRLRAIQSHFFQNEAGLDMPVFTEARQALREYADSALAVSDKDPQAAFQARLDDLAKLLPRYQQEGRDEDAVAIANALQYLSSTHQARPVVQAVQRQYSHPNLYLFASTRLAGAGVNRRIDDVSPVRENILGTDIHGTAHTVGHITLRTFPNNRTAAMALVMNGHASSNNVGYNGPVTVCTLGYTSLSATKNLFFDRNGLHPQPTIAVAHTNTTITDLSARLRIIERIGERRAAETKPQAEAIASQRAEGRLARRIDSQSASELARANREYHNRFRLPLLRRDAFPEDVRFSTTADSIRIVGGHAVNGRLGAPTAPPRIPGRADLAIRLHESMVGNAGETGLGGRTLTDERLAQIMKDATGEVPEELQITEDKDPWSITFAHDRPISVVFDDQTAVIGIHGERFTRGEGSGRRVVRKDMIISAKYRLEQQGDGSKLTRDGKVTAEYVGNEGQLSVGDIAIRTLMIKKFSALFKPEIESEGLKLPARFASFGKLSLRRMESQNGWLTLVWEKAGPTPREMATSLIDAE